MKKKIEDKILIISIILLVVTVGFYIYVYFNGRSSGDYYSSGERKVEQLSTEYYLGPTINENNDKISNA